MALFVFVAVFILIKSNFSTKRKEEADYEEQLFKGIMNAKDKAECWGLLKKHVCATQQEMLDFVWKTYEDVVNGFVDEDLKTLRRAVKRIDAEKSRRKKLRQRELVGMRRIDKRISLEKNTWFHLASNSGEQMLYCLKRMSEPCKEHVDNNFIMTEPPGGWTEGVSALLQAGGEEFGWGRRKALWTGLCAPP